MASTVLQNGIIIPEKYSRDWYADLYHNWQELDNLLGGGTPKDGTLTIQKNGDTVGTFSANQSTNETINITVPDVNDGTLTIQQNGTTVDTFTANSSTDKTVDITVPTKTSDLTNDSGFITSDDTKIPLAGSNQISGSLIPATDNSIDIGSSTKNLKMLYTKGITIDGKAIDTDANGDMTYDSHIVDTIEEQGDGYIRYSNGIQICWGSISVAIGTILSLDPPNAVYYSRDYNFNYPKGFISNPVVSFDVSTSNNHPFLNVCCESQDIARNLRTGSIMLFCTCPVTIQNETSIYIQAIGKWK